MTKIRFSSMVMEWQTEKYAAKIRGRQVFVTQGEKCYKLVSDGSNVYKTEVEHLSRNQI